MKIDKDLANSIRMLQFFVHYVFISHSIYDTGQQWLAPSPSLQLRYMASKTFGLSRLVQKTTHGPKVYTWMERQKYMYMVETFHFQLYLLFIFPSVGISNVLNTRVICVYSILQHFHMSSYDISAFKNPTNHYSHLFISHFSLSGFRISVYHLYVCGHFIYLHSNCMLFHISVFNISAFHTRTNHLISGEMKCGNMES